MTIRRFRRGAILLILLAFMLPTHTAFAKPRPIRRIQIPSIGVDLPIVVAPFRSTTWDFSRIGKQAAYLQGRPQPQQGGNVVIAAHSEFARRKPGPFYHLDQLKPGDLIVVIHDGVRYQYSVRAAWSVDPTDLGPVVQTDTDVLTLITCDDYNSKTRGYDKRLIVRAARIS